MVSDVLRRVSDRVYRLEDRFVNLYVIDADRVALVDTGTRRAEPLVRRALTELGKERDDIATVLLTHHHADHAGTAGVWQRESHAAIGVHAKDAPVLAGEERRKAHGRGMRGRMMVLFSGVFAMAYAAGPVRADRTFGDRESLEVPGLSIETIASPGHTLGSCAFRLGTDRILFAGDAVNGRQGKPEPPVWVEDAEAAEDSFRRLVSSDYDVLCPGHGKPVRKA